MYTHALTNIHNNNDYVILLFYSAFIHICTCICGQDVITDDGVCWVYIVFQIPVPPLSNVNNIIQYYYCMILFSVYFANVAHS